MDKADQIAALLAPTVASLGLELLGIDYLPSPGGALIRLYIDLPADAVAASDMDADGLPVSVGIEHCESVSREVSAQLDVEDPITGNYTLEVSSPGIDRPLFSPVQFKRFIGQSVKVVLRIPQDGRRRLQGPIAAVEGEVIVVNVDGNPVEVKHSNVDKARLVPDWVALGLAPVKPGKAGPKPAGASRTTPTKNKLAAKKPRAE